MFEPTVAAVMDQVDALRNNVDDHWQVPRVEAQLLAQLVRLGRCTSVCEIGTSYGFSTLHLASAVRDNGGRLYTFDMSPKKVTAATEHLRQAALLDVVTLTLGDARELVAKVTPDKPYDFAFIDATKDQSSAYLAALLPKLAQRAILATDNTTTHRDQLADFVAQLRALPGATSCDVPVGNGFELTLIERR
ncbi:MAG: class I SAM-dependent methyltransferase [Phycisphaeraceae bacterium]